MRSWIAASWLSLAAGCLAGESLGTISGVVYSAVSGAPLAGSTVTLAQADGAPLKSLTADRRGRYVFDGLPAGLYTVRAARPGFATGRFGQKSWNHAGRTIELPAGAGFTADLRLHRLGVITGSVVDENGEGIPGFPVNAVAAGPPGLTGPVSSAGITDDRGAYRIAGLKPGRYYVVSAARQTDDGVGLLPTYAPGVLGRAEARVVEVNVDQETTGVHLRPLAGKLLRLAGEIPAAARFGQAQATVTLFRDEESRQATIGADGRFEFSAVVPGRYTLVTTLPDANLAGYQALELADDLEGLTVNLAAAPEVQVNLVDETGEPVTDPQFVVFLSRIENAARTPPRRVDGPVAPALMPGRWRFFVITPETHMLDSVRVGDQNALAGFHLAPGRRATATIRVSRRAGRVVGRATDGDQPARGVNVICYPLAPENRTRLGGFRSMRSGLAGEFRFGGLPPGEYLLFAAGVEEFNPEEREETLRSRAAVVTVRAAGEVEQTVRVLDE
jgi:hypothetical protein